MAQQTDLAPVKPPETPVALTPCEMVRAEIAKYSGWDIDTMTAIARAENRSCDPEAVGDKHLTYRNNGRVYGYSVSVLQVRIMEGREHCDSKDISVNVKCAYEIWERQGYGSWSTFNNSLHLKYLQ